MKLIKRVNLMGDKKLIMKLNIASIPLLILFFILFTLLTLGNNLSGEGERTFLGMFIGIISLLGIIVVHELIHGLFFKLFNTEGKVKFGFKNGLAYATSPNSFYSKRNFLIILMAPFITITLLLFLMYLFCLIPPYAFIWLASIHASTCVGDFYFSYLVIKAPKNSYVEDTEQGINIYHSA
ncbi:DUF3267 domain-containing protein [Carnobacterium mobile]|uniref:DUF3267 domain-containing protein n=1 Tax=Carnobacterium mobile TaxID=2750 RepID=UPI00186745BC|nr:DUF3267 domain-containing protein [Carnobacterium mobile]